MDDTSVRNGSVEILWTVGAANGRPISQFSVEMATSWDKDSWSTVFSGPELVLYSLFAVWSAVFSGPELVLYSLFVIWSTVFSGPELVLYSLFVVRSAVFSDAELALSPLFVV